MKRLICCEQNSIKTRSENFKPEANASKGFCVSVTIYLSLVPNLAQRFHDGVATK